MSRRIIHVNKLAMLNKSKFRIQSFLLEFMNLDCDTADFVLYKINQVIVIDEVSFSAIIVS